MKKDVRPWETLSSTMALDEKWFPVRKDTVRLPSGKVVDDYFVWESPHIVTVIPVTPEGKLVLVQQYRHAMKKIMTQFPAGAVDKKESLESAARREMEEEAGYVCDELFHLGQFAPDATKMTGVMDIFIGLNAKPEGHKHYDEQEESRVIVRTIEEIWELIEGSEVQMLLMPASLSLATRYLSQNRQS